jgi:purine-binding chemotaxis protein CheW
VLYLKFTLDDKAFAIGIEQVREVFEFSRVTRVPHAPDYMRGVINLRGNVVSVVDLRLLFGMQEVTPTINTCIIIAEVHIDNHLTVLGALADSVQQLFELDRDQLEPTPRLDTSINTEYSRAIVKHGGESVIILDIDRLFSNDPVDSEFLGQLA